MNDRLSIIAARTALRMAGVLATVLIIAGCGGGSDDSKSSGDAKSTGADKSVGSDGLRQVDGRAVSANDAEVVLRTADGERTFKVKPEDVGGVGPEHVQSHVGIPTLGFRIYYRTESDVEYAVSAEEIPASGLGFD